MDKKRILIISISLIGICLGYLITDFVNNPKDFQLKSNMGLLFIITGLFLFILSHLIVKEKKST